MGRSTSVSTTDGLVAAVGDESVERIVVTGRLFSIPALRLAPGQQLVGADPEAALVFAEGQDGVCLSRDNEVSGLHVEVAVDRRAVHNDTAVHHLGTLRLTDLTTAGQVQVLAREQVRAGRVEVDGLDVVAADTRHLTQRPELLGVGVLQGAFTLWNQQVDDHAVLVAELRGVSVGRDRAPVRGSGVFVSGGGRYGGRLAVSVLETGPVFTDGGITEGSHDTISGGVFVLHGAHVAEVHNRGPVTTYGVNDMMLDNWGTVDAWTAYAPLTSFGRSGVGLVNFGTIGALRVRAPIETHGIGARGLNVYPLDEDAAPTVYTAELARVTTHGDAAVGIQVGQPIRRLVVHGGIHTHGGTGESLVRGRIATLAAHAISIQPGGRVASVDIEGGVTSAGDGVSAVDVRGEVTTMHVAGGIHASGSSADALVVGGGTLGLRDTDVSAADGVAIRVAPGGGLRLHNAEARGTRGDIVIEQASHASGK